MPSHLRKITASLIVFALLGNAVLAEASQATLWADRRSGSHVASPLPPSPVAPRPDEKLSPVERAVVSLRPEFGSVRSVREPRGASRGVVVAVSDIHGNPEAQENIARAIRSLAGAGFTRLGLEGAPGPIDVAPLRRAIDRSDLRDIAAYLSSRDEISGPAGAALRCDAEITLSGIDDAALHAANADAYLRSRAAVSRLDAALADLRRTTNAAKDLRFSSRLRALDRTVEAYHAGRAPLGDYLAALAAVEPAGENVRLFLDALALERSLDFAAVERERAALLSRLSAKATREQLSALLDRTMAFRTGRLASGAYYRFVSDVCSSAGVPLASYPALDRYARYVSLSDRVDGGALLSEAAVLERKAYADLATTPEAKTIAGASRWTMLAAKLRDFSLTREEWADYARLARPAGAPSNEALEPFETFYRVAEMRDAALASNAGRFLGSSGGVVVAGGFHGDALRARLSAAGWTVIEFQPRVTRADGGAGYLSVFAREKTPLEKLYAGEKLFLKSDPFPASIRSGLIPMAALGLRALKGTVSDPLAALRAAAPDAPIDGVEVAVNGRTTATVTARRGNSSVDVTVVRSNRLESISQAPAAAPLLVLPAIKVAFAAALVAVHRARGETRSLATAMIDVEIVAHQRWFRTYFVPFVELIALPGAALLIYAVGPGSTMWLQAGPYVSALAAGLLFGAAHNTAGERQSRLQFVVRSMASSVINAAAVVLFTLNPTPVGFIVSVVAAYVLHALWNEAAAAGFELSVDDPSRPRFIRGARVITASGEGVVRPVRLEQGQLPVDDDTAERLGARILDVVARRKTEGTREEGRSLVVPLETPITVGGRAFDSVVLKRVTYRGQAPTADPWEPDERESVDQPTHFLRTGHDGTMFFVEAWRRATGTGPVSDNVYEFREMRRAFDAGIPTGFPFGIGEFLTLEQDGRRMGFMAYLDNAASRTRVGAVIGAEMDRVHSVAAANGDLPGAINEAITLTNSLAEPAARTLWNLHEAGIVHRSPHTQQFGVPSDGRMNLYDWDDAVWIGRLTRDEYIFYRFNDLLQFMWGVHQLARRANPGMPIPMFYRMFLPEMIGTPEPLGFTARAYFNSEAAARIGVERIDAALAPASTMPFSRFWKVFDALPAKFDALDRPQWALAEDIGGRTYDRILEQRVLTPLARSGLPSDEIRPHLRALHEFALTNGAITAADVARELRGVRLRRGWADQIAASIRRFAELPSARETLPRLVAPPVIRLMSFVIGLARPFSTNRPGAEPLSKWLDPHSVESVERAEWRRQNDEIAEALAERPFFRVFAIPAFEIPGLPGLAIVLFPALLTLFPAYAPMLTVLVAGFAFSSVHGIPGRGQSFSHFVVRGIASAGINAAALSLYLGLGGLGGTAAAVLAGYALHAAWNASFPAVDLAPGGWKRRLNRMLERAVAGQSRAADPGDLKRMFRVDVADGTRAAAWLQIARALPEMSPEVRSEFTESLVLNALDSLPRRALRKSAVDVLDRVLGTSWDPSTNEVAWNLVVSRIRIGTAGVRAALIPIAIPQIMRRILAPAERNDALSDLADVVTVKLDSPQRAIVRKALIEALSSPGPDRLREAMPPFLHSYVMANPDAHGEILQIYGALADVAKDAAAPQMVRAASIAALPDVLKSSNWKVSRDLLGKDMLAIVRNEPETELGLLAFLNMIAVANEIEGPELRLVIARQMITMVNYINPAGVLGLAPLLRRILPSFEDMAQRRHLVRAMIESLPDWEARFARRPEALGELGDILGYWLDLYPGEATANELAAVADHVVRFYPRVGRMYAGLLIVLLGYDILKPIEAKDRLPYAHWDLHPSRLERDAIEVEINDRPVRVIGRVHGVTEGLTVVQSPEFRILFAQTGDAVREKWAESLPPTFDLIGSTVYQDGRTLIYYPARLVTPGRTIDVMVLLGEQVKADNARDISDVTFEETLTRKNSLVRAWIPWRIGTLAFRRPGVALYDAAHRNAATEPEPYVLTFGHSPDGKTAYYQFPETGVVYAVQLNPDTQLQSFRQVQAARARLGGTIEIEQEQLTLNTRARILNALNDELETMPEASRSMKEISLTDDTVAAVVRALERRNHGIFGLLMGRTKKEGLTAVRLDRLVDDFMNGRHGMNDSAVAEISRAFEEVYGGSFVPSLGIVLTEEGREWLIDRAVELGQELTPLPPAIETAVATLRNRDMAAARPDAAANAEERLFAWLAAPNANATARLNALQRVLSSPLEQIETTLATYVRLLFRGNEFDLVVDETNRIEAQELGQVMRLSASLLDPKIPNEFHPRPTYVQVTVPNRDGRTVFPGNAGSGRTVGEVIDSVQNGVPSRASVAKVILQRPGSRDRTVTMGARVRSGDSLLVELKTPGQSGRLHAIANVGAATALTAGVALMLAVFSPAASAGAIALQFGVNLAVAAGSIGVAIVAHELWHWATAWIIYFLEHTMSPRNYPAARPAFRGLEVRFNITSPFLRLFFLAASVSAIPLAYLVPALLPVGDVRTIALAGVILTNALAILPIKRLAEWASPRARHWMPTDGDEMNGVLILAFVVMWHRAAYYLGSAKMRRDPGAEPAVMAKWRAAFPALPFIHQLETATPVQLQWLLQKPASEILPDMRRFMFDYLFDQQKRRTLWNRVAQVEDPTTRLAIQANLLRLRIAPWEWVLVHDVQISARLENPRTLMTLLTAAAIMPRADRRRFVSLLSASETALLAARVRLAPNDDVRAVAEESLRTLGIADERRGPGAREKLVAAAVADAALALRGASVDRDGFADALVRISRGLPASLNVNTADGRGIAIASQSGPLDLDAYVAALKVEFQARGLSLSLDAVRGDLQAVSFVFLEGTPLPLSMARTDRVGNQVNVAVLSPTLDEAAERRLADQVAARRDSFGSMGILIASSEAQEKRVREYAGGKVLVLRAADVLGEREGRGTVEMAALVAELGKKGIDLANFSSVRLLTPAGRIIVTEGLPDNLSWFARSVILLVDDTLRAAEVSMLTISLLERTARLVAEQA